MLRMNVSPELWREASARLRPFVARQVSPGDVDDVLQDVFVRMQRGLGALREEERFTSWLFQIARSSVAEHARTRARHPLARDERPDVAAPANDDDERQASRMLAACVSLFVAQLPSPYREAVTLVELEGLTTREAAELIGISVSGMKSRVQRGRAQLRALFEACCEIALDARGKVTEYTPRAQPCSACAQDQMELRTADADAVRALLEANELPTDDLDDPAITLIGAFAASSLVGVVGMQSCGSAALLREAIRATASLCPASAIVMRRS
jgi:RNA polymerase sigma-70 factor (ECF subfamily)